VKERPFRAVLTDDEQVLVVSGLLDEISVPELRAALRGATHGYTRDLVVDLSDLDFLPSVAIGALIAAMKNGVQVSLVAEAGCLAARVLDMCGIAFGSPGTLASPELHGSPEPPGSPGPPGSAVARPDPPTVAEGATG
jgi:anti-anti-sigma factor